MAPTNDDATKKDLDTITIIDSELLAETLFISLKQEVKIIKYEVSPAIAPGENFLSIVHKVFVTYSIPLRNETRTQNFIIKTLPTVKFLLDWITKRGGFTREINVYKRFLPAMRNYFQKSFPNEQTFFAPTYYETKRNNIVVLEDLVNTGFNVPNRLDQLDYEQTAMALETIAKFHALSVKVDQEDEQLVEILKNERFFDKNKDFSDTIDTRFLNAANTFEKAGTPLSKYATIIKEFAKKASKEVDRLKLPSIKFNVVNHGDLWINNLMYKNKDDGTAAELKLVDFQSCRYSSPALDLIYFFFTSIRPSVLRNNINNFINIYYNNLSADLAALKLEHNYTITDLHEDIRERRNFALTTIITNLPVVTAERVSSADNKGGFDLERKIKDLQTTTFADPKYLEIVTKLFEILEEHGLIDVKEDTKEKKIKTT